MDPDLSKIFEAKEFKKGDIILQQNDKVDGLYVIKSGKVDVERDGEIIATLEAGDFFGEMGLLLHERRSATIKVTSDELSTYFLSKEIYAEVKDELGEDVVEKALQRYSETYKKYI
ncbi:cyclic nucleotide-binding domain-containing protein [Patescibacteria group bacterium]|nr:cyclic nucleotide-binding domain-containing protein [Patescibacteria group bacterium]MBU1016101.1 cyclic nucleotide-binding domain-containing protein [Patescibacteria group bacterium]MBU1684844.1 cyclic nucleotide-binding domain-containing protein [Patescibacteria group bacterium]MBU1938560.1 cyclic nucleotide-binding domain-containing protein [Patescibacteria group bacterium]